MSDELHACNDLNCNICQNQGENVIIQTEKEKKKYIRNSLQCAYLNCKKQPSYNFIENSNRVLYCSKHKLNGMVDIRNKKCVEPNCNKNPTYNYKHLKNRLYCSKHKKDGMVDIKSKICIEPECKVLSAFNYKLQKIPLYCVKHKKDEMINIISKTCIEPNCGKQPCYNYYGAKSGLYCTNHKKNGMIDIKHKLCIVNNCKTIPIYNYEKEKKPLYCQKHKKDGMINIIDKKCLSEWCLSLAKIKIYEGYCAFCYSNLYPDKTPSRNYKTKESSVVQSVISKFPEFSWVSDKIIEDGCSKRRPDLRCDFGSHIIIVEIDENQHRDYDCSCENKRLMEISQDVGHRPIVFIRFNPDDYINKNNEKVQTCWRLNKLGVMSIMIKYKEVWENRLNVLIDRIQYWIENLTDKTVEVEQLYYDGFD